MLNWCHSLGAHAESSRGVGGSRAPPLGPAGGAAAAGRKGRAVRGAKRFGEARRGVRSTGRAAHGCTGGRRSWGGGPASLLPKFLALAQPLALPVGVTPRAGSSAGGQLRAEGGGRRQKDRPRQEPSSREGPGRRVPEPGPPGTARGRCCGGRRPSSRHWASGLIAGAALGARKARAPPVHARPPCTYPASR